MDWLLPISKTIVRLNPNFTLYQNKILSFWHNFLKLLIAKKYSKSYENKLKFDKLMEFADLKYIITKLLYEKYFSFLFKWF